MEDQQPDPSDLTDAAAPVPQGKSSRSRHRLPRQKLRHPDDDVTEAAETDTDTVEPATGQVEAEPAAEPDPEPDPEPEPEPASRRGRFSLRRRKATTSAPVSEPVSAEPVDVESAAVELTEPAKAPDEVVEEPAESGEPVESTESDEPEPVLVPHRPAGRGLKLAAVAAGVVVVATAAFAGATLQPYLADRAAVQIKLEVATTAAEAISTLWTYTPNDIDKLADRTARYLGGDFATQYRQFIDGIVEANKQAQVTNSTEVKGAAVESLTSTEASAIVYTNSVSTSPVTKGIPSLRYLSYRLTLEHHGGHWLITRMQDITSLDLTPRL